jgi:hypothetical protein
MDPSLYLQASFRQAAGCELRASDDGVNWMLGRADALPFPDGSFDA